MDKHRKNDVDTHKKDPEFIDPHVRIEPLKDRFSDLFTALPKPTMTATTDSDGKFSLRIPVKGRYAIAATSSRKVGDKDEDYYWLVWFEAYGTAKKRMLSNNNTTDSESPESVIKTTTYAPN